jgi:hypothetical protein
MSALLRPSGMDNVSPASDPDMVRIGTTERGVGPGACSVSISRRDG